MNQENSNEEDSKKTKINKIIEKENNNINEELKENNNIRKESKEKKNLNEESEKIENINKDSKENQSSNQELNENKDIYKNEKNNSKDIESKETNEIRLNQKKIESKGINHEKIELKETIKKSIKSNDIYQEEKENVIDGEISTQNNNQQEENKLTKNKESSSGEKENDNNALNSNKNLIIHETFLEIPRKERELYLISSFNHFFQKKTIIKKIEKGNNFSIIQKEVCFEEDSLDYLSKIKPRGLVNLGGCCYMNATLQCFYHIKEFTDYFLKNKKYIKLKNGLISIGILDVIEGLSQEGPNNYYKPKKFKDNLIEVEDSFKGTEGKDSGDLVSIILSSCHEELGNDSELQDMSLNQREEHLIFLDIFCKNVKTPSIIMDLFAFYVRIKNICFECGTQYYSIYVDNMVTFSLERVFRMNASDITIKNSKRIVSLENCLSSFSFDGSFDTQKFECKYCKKKSSIFKVRTFATLPKYLIMIMNRGKDEKFECNVSFEENLDLNESYMNIKGVPKEKNTKYTLLGGTILYGSKGYGHTVAFCKHFDGDYYIFNDSNFRKTNFNEIKKLKIYLLFYKNNN